MGLAKQEMQERRQWSKTIVSAATPSKVAQRNELASDVEAWLAAGGTIDRLPTPTYRPLLESPRKPLPEDERYKRLVSREINAERTKRGFGPIPNGFLAAPDAAVYIGVSAAGFGSLRRYGQISVGMVMRNGRGGELPVYALTDLDDYRSKSGDLPMFILTPPGLMNADAVAEFFNVSRTSLNRRIKNGSCPAPTFEIVTRNGKGMRGWELSDLLRSGAK